MVDGLDQTGVSRFLPTVALVGTAAHVQPEAVEVNVQPGGVDQTAGIDQPVACLSEGPLILPRVQAEAPLPMTGIVFPLVEFMREQTMQSWVQGIDETPCTILCPELGRTRSRGL
jgi:hypothetical protein